MRAFIKNALLFAMPLFIVSLCYVVTDPFKTIFKHASYTSSYILLSRGNVSTMVFLNNRHKYHYDSFVFGSSRSCGYSCKDWLKYLPKASVPYSFSAWNENCIGIYKRLKLADSLNQAIKNVIIVLDVDRAFNNLNVNDLPDDHYLINGYTRFNYYTRQYFNYLGNPKLIVSSIDYALFHKRRAYMNKFVTRMDLDPVNNDLEPNAEQEIQADSANYYKGTGAIFYKRAATQQIAGKQLNTYYQACLNNIFSILRKHHTRYKIIISPIYDQVKLNPDDLHQLQAIFGAANVYDYSGINSITNNKFNYLNDAVHYRKRVGELILKEVYARK